jgi:Tfp pilus assembly protein PilE
MRKNKGISLLVLVITIAVSLILLSTVVISTASAIDNATVVAFAKDLKTVSDAVENYYITNSTIPKIDATNLMSSSQVKGLVDTNKLNTFQTEIDLNLDTSCEEFYQVDLNKLNVNKTPYGSKLNGNNDVFVVSVPNLNIYYLKGINAKGTSYFSLSSKLIGVTNLAKESTDTSTTEVISSAGISVTKINGFTNKMGINVKTNLASGEVLKINPFGVDVTLSSTVGVNDISFNKLSDLTGIFTVTDDTNFNNLAKENKIINILKYSNGNLLGSVRIDLGNYDVVTPDIVTASEVRTSYPTMNTIKFDLLDNVSGIKEVRYEYLTKYNSVGVETSYYENVSDFDTTYMKTKAKLANVVNNSTTINAPKSIKSLKVMVLDKAGNASLYTQPIVSNPSISYKVNSTTTTSVDITAYVNSTLPNGIKTISFYKSSDGVNYGTALQTYTLNSNTALNSQQYTITSLTGSVAYIQIKAVGQNNVEETIRFTVDLSNSSNVSNYFLQTPTGGSLYKDVNGDLAAIPSGFSLSTVSSEQVVKDGLVIKDNSTGSEFVWIPVYKIPGGFIQRDFMVDRVEYNISITDSWSNADYVLIRDSVRKYGGFYYSRYFIKTNDKSESTGTNATSTYGNLLTNATRIYPSSNGALSVVSYPTTGTHHDTLVAWIMETDTSKPQAGVTYKNMELPGGVTYELAQQSFDTGYVSRYFETRSYTITSSTTYNYRATIYIK